MEEKWIAYVHLKHKPIIKLETERAPGYGWSNPRPATDAEIDAEKAERARREAERRAQAEFNARVDVAHAKTVHGYLEHSLERVIDAFTADEWLKLAETLRTQYERTRKD